MQDVEAFCAQQIQVDVDLLGGTCRRVLIDILLINLTFLSLSLLAILVGSSMLVRGLHRIKLFEHLHEISHCRPISDG